MPGRKANSGNYRYGFNGKEKDDSGEWGSNTNYDYGFRIYNPSIAKFLSLDPLQRKFPDYSPYSFSLNNPNYFKDDDGREPISAVIEAITSFAVSVGMDFFTAYLLEGRDATVALNSVGWGSATLDAVLTFGASLAGAKGVGTGKKIQKFAKSKIGKVTRNMVINIMTNVTKNIENGKYNDEDGNFSSGKILNTSELKTLFLEATVEALLEQGLGDAAKELVLKFQFKRAKKLRDKLLKKIIDESPSSRQVAKIKGVAGGVNEKTYKATAVKAPEGCEGCVEDVLNEALGEGKKRMTKMTKPRHKDGTVEDVPVCVNCEKKYGRETFKEKGTQFRSDGAIRQKKNINN